MTFKLFFTLLFYGIFLVKAFNENKHSNKKIYDSLDGSHYCFRLMNETHQVGCAGNFDGNSGVVKLIRSDHEENDVDFVLNTGTDPPYIPVLTLGQFKNITLIRSLKSHGTKRVNGLVLLDTGKPSYLTSDRSCPNEYFSLYQNDSRFNHCQKQQWNLPVDDHRDGIIFDNFPFPVFLLRNRSQIDLLNQKIANHSGDEWPKLSIELKAPMHAAINSVTCLRRSRLSNRFNINGGDVLCDPLGGLNIFHHTINLNLNRTIEKNSVIMFAARQDSFSMFDNLSPGADSVVSSMTTLLAIAQMLNQESIKKQIESITNRSLMFALFDGEAFDYIGSSDTVYQMEQSTFPLIDPLRVPPESNEKYSPINLEHLSHLIELNQLFPQQGSTESNQNIYLHKHLKSSKPLKQLIDLIKKESISIANLTIKEIENGIPLPPASAQSFLKKRSDDYFRVLVVTNHEKKYINRFYNSIYDDNNGLNLDQLTTRLTSIATLFGRVAYRLITDSDAEPVSLVANETLIHQLLYCFLVNSNCVLFREVQENSDNTSSNETEPPYSSYVSVYNQNQKKLREVTQLILFRLTGEIISGVNKTQCNQMAEDEKDKQHTYRWMVGDGCIRSSAYMSLTSSPSVDAESMETFDDRFKDYALWTESKWQDISIRMFMMPSFLQQIMTLGLGIIIFVFSFLLVWLIDRNAYELFCDNRSRTNGIGGFSPLECQQQSPQVQQIS